MTGRAQQSDLGIKNYMNRNVGKQIREASFTGEGLYEARVFQRRQDARRNAASQINTACRHHLERQVA